MSALSNLYVEMDGEDARTPTARFVASSGPRNPSHSRTSDHRKRSSPCSKRSRVESPEPHRGWKTYARAMILAYVGTRPSQLMRIDVKEHVLPYLDAETPMISCWEARQGTLAADSSRRGGCIPGVHQVRRGWEVLNVRFLQVVDAGV